MTTGSTGVPEGIVHTHSTVCTGLVEGAHRQGLDRPGIRVFQWAAYTFDVALTEIYAPLIHGGCICIPSEEERLNDVEGAMNRMKCEWAFFTPTFARFFRRYKVPSFKTLAMGGEAATADDINAWVHRVKVLQVYGPAECVTWLLKAFNAPSPKTISFGRPTNVHGWIVEPQNPARLSPVGAVGELLIEGPGVFIEYLNDKVRTEASFIEAPPWRTAIGAPCTSRIYKSGDLVRYLPDGEMTYVGRKDAMVKLRGQRIDLEGIESLLRACVDDIADVAVDLVIPSGKNRDKALVAFVCSRDRVAGPDSVLRLAPSWREQLKRDLPDFMVPHIYYPIDSLPYNASRKLDRKVLRQFASALTIDELLSASKHATSTAQLQESANGLTPTELQFRQFWAEPETKAFLFTYTDIFKGPSVAEMARNARKILITTSANVEAFSLLPPKMKSQILRDVAVQCRVSESEIEDVFLLTLRQEGLWALSLVSNGSYVAHFPIRLRQGIDVSRFRTAWDDVVTRSAFMRTRITQSASGTYQVVLKRGPSWKKRKNTEEYVREDMREPLDFGEQLTRFALIQEEQQPAAGLSSSMNLILWTSHHALYDGHSIPLFLNAVAKSYRGEISGPEVPFTRFIGHLQETDENVYKEYWRRRLDVLEAAAKEHSSISPLKCDVTSKNDLQATVDYIAAEVGYVNLVVANSGSIRPSVRFNPSHSLPELRQILFADFSMEDMTETLNLNVTAAFFTMTAFLELLDAGNQNALKGGFGRPIAKGGVVPAIQSQVIFTTSISAFSRHWSSSPPYLTSKVAIMQVTKHASKQLARFGIRVNAIAPGVYPSDLASVLTKDRKPEEESIDDQRFIPARRFGGDEEMAGAILYLTSRTGSFFQRVYSRH
ncbi:Uu.00g021280.m01.CDS01 [Anthostomella pinea]|uniref:Uu.00g021280.m01.CDS01 n=1 Tax=Anthostomella pinea TaxID=933095 RepID=A0AAI8W0A1_9PEZI|nr:Uu.00g021280.m01.CDS01 [Anthostomella pinea]